MSQASRSLGVFASSLLLALGCTSAAVEPPPTGAEHVSAALPGLDPGEHLLLTPVGNPESLAGRAVTRGPGGEWVLASAPAPGCSVTIRRVPAEWQRDFAQRLGDVAVLEAGLPGLASLRGETAREMRNVMRVHNQEEIQAEVTGPCGSPVITMVRVGTGLREVQRLRHNDAEGHVGVQGLEGGGGAKRWETVAAALRWSTPQAWSFKLGEAADKFSVELAMPESLVDGQEYELRVLSSRAAWLIVFCEERDGAITLLLPNANYPRVKTPGNRWTAAPRLRASLRSPRAPAQERLIVFAVDDEQLYTSLLPVSGQLGAREAKARYDALRVGLAAQPVSHWSERSFSYRIVPKGLSKAAADSATPRDETRRP